VKQKYPLKVSLGEFGGPTGMFSKPSCSVHINSFMLCYEEMELVDLLIGRDQNHFEFDMHEHELSAL
jgi:hypothetical protein